MHSNLLVYSSSFGEGRNVAAIAEGRPVPRSWPNTVSATQWLVKVLDWGTLCLPSTTDSPSPPTTAYCLVIPQRGWTPARTCSLPGRCLSQPPLHLCPATVSVPGDGDIQGLG